MQFLYTLNNIAVILIKEIREAEKDDWVRVFAKIENRKDYTANTKRDYKIIIRSFIAWMFDMDPCYDGYLEVIKWLRISEPKK